MFLIRALGDSELLAVAILDWSLGLEGSMIGWLVEWVVWSAINLWNALLGVGEDSDLLLLDVTKNVVLGVLLRRWHCIIVVKALGEQSTRHGSKRVDAGVAARLAHPLFLSWDTLWGRWRELHGGGGQEYSWRARSILDHFDFVIEESVFAGSLNSRWWCGGSAAESAAGEDWLAEFGARDTSADDLLAWSSWNSISVRHLGSTVASVWVRLVVILVGAEAWSLWHGWHGWHGWHVALWLWSAISCGHFSRMRVRWCVNYEFVGVYMIDFFRGSARAKVALRVG